MAKWIGERSVRRDAFSPETYGFELAKGAAGMLWRVRPDAGTVDCLLAGQIVGMTGVGVTVDWHRR